MSGQTQRTINDSNDHVFEDDYEPQSHIFHKLMQYKIKKVLLVSSLYDAFIIEEEGLIPELVIGEYSHLDLSSPPHVFRVSSGEKALKSLEGSEYDLVITMAKNIGMDPFQFGEKVKQLRADLPVILLATDTSDLYDTRDRDSTDGVDKIFFWNGDSNLFIAIIKYFEDQMNVQYDTSVGNVRVIILIEDSVRYYSMFLPIIYSELVHQTQRLISGDLNEMQRRLRMRVRPKVLMAETYEQAMELFKDYQEFVLGVISDVSFKRDGVMDMDAGCLFVKEIRQKAEYLPVLMQSSSQENLDRARDIGAFFIHKLSPTLLKDLRHFLMTHLGFGEFIFLLPHPNEDSADEEIAEPHFEATADVSDITKGNDWLHENVDEIGRAGGLKEFEELIKQVPPESIRFHGDRHDFSNWLMARGEFKLAKELRPRTASEFSSSDEVKNYLIGVFRASRREKQLGIITDFKLQTFEFESSFSRLGGGSLGGKGRGIAFFRSIISRFGLQGRFSNVSIFIPHTVVIGTEEFDKFIKLNNLSNFSNIASQSDEDIAFLFLGCSLSEELEKDLERLLEQFRSPLAVRSSSLLEDSQNFPFAGIYSTYMLSNNHPEKEQRVEQLKNAVKLVYASMFYRNARTYIESTASKVEEEKMAVVIQKTVGRDYGGRFYPHFSGVAQSYNFYPVSHQKFEEGIVSVAVGLGKAVVGGEKVLRFSPAHPLIIPEFSSADKIFQNSQKFMYAIDTNTTEPNLTENEDATLLKANIADIESDGTLDTMASTYDAINGIIRDSTDYEGTNLITFAGILKYQTFPLAQILTDILAIGERSMGCPVEIEFAVILNHPYQITKIKKPEFAILQIRPVVTPHEHCDISWKPDDPNSNVFLHSDTALGNGIETSIKDIVFVPQETFEPGKTRLIAEEVGEINNSLSKQHRPYLLIGPGRWGTEDPWLGIPVDWSQISGVKVVVETAMKNFDIEPSQGTHFFQNMISRKIGYITIPSRSKDSFLDWDWLKKQQVENGTAHVKHVSLPTPLTVKLDGRCGGALIQWNTPEKNDSSQTV